MRIYYITDNPNTDLNDLNGRDLKHVHEIPLDDPAHTIVNELHKLIEHRLRLIHDEIEKEPWGFICCFIPKRTIEFDVYTEPLKVKMRESITEQDLAYVFERVDKKNY